MRALLAFVLAGCGGAATELPLEMPVGVDPRAEATAVARSLESDGFALVRRVDAPGVSAVALRSRDGASAVRVVTSRGVGLALDAGRGLEGFESLALPIERGLDVDGDGLAEIAIEGRTRGRRSCVELVRVDSEGYLRGVRAVVPFGLEGCLVAVDGERLVGAVSFLHDAEVAFTMRASGGALVPDPDGALLGEQREAREVELETLRRAGDVGSVLRVALEMGLLVRFAGAPSAESVGAFDRALTGLVLSEEAAAEVRSAREALAALR